MVCSVISHFSNIKGSVKYASTVVDKYKNVVVNSFHLTLHFFDFTNGKYTSYEYSVGQNSELLTLQ